MTQLRLPAAFLILFLLMAFTVIIVVDSPPKTAENIKPAAMAANLKTVNVAEWTIRNYTEADKAGDFNSWKLFTNKAGKKKPNALKPASKLLVQN